MLNFPTNGFPGTPATGQPLQQPGGFPQQPGGFPSQQPGGFPQGGFPQGGFPPQQPGGFPQQPGGFPQGQQQQQQLPPGGFSGQPGAPPGQGGFPQQGGGFPQGGFPQQGQHGAPPVFGGAAAAGAYAPMGGGGDLDSLFAGSDAVSPQSRTPRLDINGVYLLSLSKITGGFTDTEKKPFVEFEWRIEQPDPLAGPTMPAGKIIGMFVMMPSHKLKILFISNIKEILLPIMSAKYGREILSHEVGGPQIAESYSAAQPYAGVRLWCKAQNTGKLSGKGNPIWEYTYQRPQS